MSIQLYDLIRPEQVIDERAVAGDRTSRALQIFLSRTTLPGLNQETEVEMVLG